MPLAAVVPAAVLFHTAAMPPVAGVVIPPRLLRFTGLPFLLPHIPFAAVYHKRLGYLATVLRCHPARACIWTFSRLHRATCGPALSLTRLVTQRLHHACLTPYRRRIPRARNDNLRCATGGYRAGIHLLPRHLPSLRATALPAVS